MAARRRHLLLVGASDSSGGSGLQADLRVCAAQRLHPLTVVTAVTAQSPSRLERSAEVDVATVRAQLTALSTVTIDAVKIGVVPTVAAVRLLAEWLDDARPPVVLDPVLATTGGQPLLDAAAVEALAAELLPRVDLVTPNLPELRRLADAEARGRSEQVAAARRLGGGRPAVLLKGGHGEGAECHDLLITASEVLVHTHPRLPGGAVRGTGCTLATAVAAALARGRELPLAVEEGIRYVQRALRSASPLAEGIATL